MYTTNIGNYRPERNDILCYTEDKLGSPHYSSRMYKILSHIYDQSDWSVYVDADIFLPDGVETRLIEELKKSGKLIGVFRHPWRDCVYEEGKEIIRLQKDSEENVKKFLEEIRKEGWPEHNGLAACGILVRKRTRETKLRNNYWWAAICSFSRRDQLSFPLIWNDVAHYYEGNIYDFKK
jgi:hypothetical protein